MGSFEKVLILKNHFRSKAPFDLYNFVNCSRALPGGFYSLESVYTVNGCRWMQSTESVA